MRRITKISLAAMTALSLGAVAAAPAEAQPYWGPGGGYHVWLRLARPTAAARLAPLVDAFAAAWPSLDRSPLSNSRTGCVRAPGSPHRMGGASIPLGDVDIRPVALSRLLGVLEQTGGRYGLQTMCEAGGTANATILERIVR